MTIRKHLTLYLGNFGFKEGFCRWVKMLNADIRGTVHQYGSLSESFNIEHGCRQGDPISPYLFILCVQITYLLIVNDQNLRGIKINGIEYKITQFTKDITLFLDGSKNSLAAALDVLDIFGCISGLRINNEKTRLIWIGKKHTQRTSFNLVNIKMGTIFNLLGIFFSIKLESMIELIQNMFYKFIWSNKPDKVKRETLSQRAG